MTQEELKQLREDLAQYVAKYPSQAKAAASLNLSKSTISSMLGKDWESVGDDTWRRLAAQLGTKSGWQLVETTTYRELTSVLEDAQAYQNVMWATGPAGCGKSTTAGNYRMTHEDTYVVLCSEDMRKADFVRAIARATGVRADGLTVIDTLELVMSELVQRRQPLLIFDEADKLTDHVIHYFITLYNRMEDKCGIVFLSTDYIRRRMTAGLRLNKKGYNEIYSRIGRRFFVLDEIQPTDVYGICRANGIVDEKQIASIIKDTEESDFDLRRVKRAIHREKLIAER